MAVPNASEKIIQQGYACNVVVYGADGVSKTLALVQNASYNEDFNVVGAQCLGFFGDVSLDAQGYKCTLTLGVFVALKPKDDITVPFLDGGNVTLQRFTKTRQEVALSGKGSVISQIDFVDLVSKTVYNSFSQCIITSNSGNIAPNAYVTANMQLMCIERTI
jgi:hypothetical protein